MLLRCMQEGGRVQEGAPRMACGITYSSSAPERVAPHGRECPSCVGQPRVHVRAGGGTAPVQDADAGPVAPVPIVVVELEQGVQALLPPLLHVPLGQVEHVALVAS